MGSLRGKQVGYFRTWKHAVARLKKIRALSKRNHLDSSVRVDEVKFVRNHWNTPSSLVRVEDDVVLAEYTEFHRSALSAEPRDGDILYRVEWEYRK